MSQEYHYVYLIVNKIDLKLYIGKHSTNDLNDGYFGSGADLKKQIRLYGKENFEKIIALTCNIHRFFCHIGNEGGEHTLEKRIFWLKEASGFD